MSDEARVIHVQGIAPTTTVQALNDYFSFVGDVEAVQFGEQADTAGTKSAKVTFKRPSAATSAVMSVLFPFVLAGPFNSLLV